MGFRVFLVEDARNMHVMMATLLAELGNMTLAGSARTEAEALLWLEENAGEWDLAVIDLVLEQGSGVNVVARAKATHPGGEVVVFSGYASPGIAEHLRRIGADAVFDKAETEAFVGWIYQSVPGNRPGAQA
jgi:DNA-binding NarL/FixJ family response regulator